MSPPDTAAIILAAGLGTRMRSGRAKVLHPLGGVPLVSWVARAVAPLARRIIVVVGHERDAVRAAVLADGRLREAGVEIGFAVQEEQLGTGHALACALPELGETSTWIVLNGDVPCLSTGTVEELLTRRAGGAAAVLTFRPEDATGYGRIVRDDDDRVSAIVEHRDCTPEQLGIDEVNSGTYAFDGVALRPVIESLDRGPAGEIYLTDAIERLAAEGRGVVASETAEAEALGINTQAQLADAQRAFHSSRVAELQEAGVTVVDPGQVRVDADVRVGAGTVLFPGCSLEGTTRIGERCEIGSLVRLTDATVGDRCTLRGPLAVAEEEVAADTRLAPGD